MMLYADEETRQYSRISKKSGLSSGRLCDLPSETKLIITIDTEEDSWGDYRHEGNAVDNIARIPRLQALFDRYGAKPTYLVNWPVITDRRACQIFKEIHAAGGCEIGTHCHPWNTPPFEEDISGVNSMMCNLPAKLVNAKVANLAAATEERLHVRPTSFRAGRWGFGRYVAEALIEQGYAVDSSVCPTVDWRNEFGPDYSCAPDRPYRFNPDRILVPDVQGQLLEIPASMGFLQKQDTMLRKLIGVLTSPVSRRLHLNGILERIGLLNFRWLSPEVSSAADMITLSRALISKGCTVLNLSFHSTSLLPGLSPYVQSQSDLDHFLHRIEDVLAFAAGNHIKFSTLSDHTC
jgi:hypothetical protein